MGSYSFSKAVKKAETDAIQEVEYATKRFIQYFNDPNSTSEDAEDLWKQIQEEHGEIGKDSLEAARDEAKEHIVGADVARGWSLEEAEARFEERWKEVKEYGDKVRD